MKKILTLTAVCAMASNAHAIPGACSTSTACTGNSNIVQGSICDTSERKCYTTGSVNFYVDSCKTCIDGSVPSLITSSYGGCNISYAICGQVCPQSCSNLAWADAGTGYQVRCNISSYTCEYRCADNYYGSPSSALAGCTVCPSSGGVAGQSVAGDNSTITRCYIPSGTSFSDSTGSGTYTANCYWSN